LFSQDPFVLIITTRKFLTPYIKDMLRRNNSICLVLSEEFAIKDNGNLEAVRNSNEVFAELQSGIRKDNSEGMVHFDTPAGIGWNGIKIKFVDGHTVSIYTDRSHGRYNYTQMGMVNTKNSEPNRQWHLLRAFAESYGQIDWKNRFASDRLKKQKQELSSRLRRFFRIDGDPIEWIKDEKAYKCRFKILPDNADY